ncbi:hypothetical protein [Salinarimonas sp.]|uniref:hypothetical protein n=1 Tax=Salinarimonas sp. TaxID=2766526 RepID=UPI0039187AC6
MFVRLGLIVAWLMLIFGVLRLGTGLFVASYDDPAARAAAAVQYLGTDSSGQSIDKAIITIILAIALGVLVEIGQAATGKRQRADKN